MEGRLRQKDFYVPGIGRVTLNYGSDGQVTSADWAGASPITRSYNDRGWTSGIGDVSAPEAFAATYEYVPDGNVRRHAMNSTETSQVTYKYGYDALDRLSWADAGAEGGGAQAPRHTGVRLLR